MRRLQIPDQSLIPPNLRKEERLSDPDLDEVIRILSKDHYIRTKKESERAAHILVKTNAFNKYITEKLDKKNLVEVLSQSMKLEHIPKDSVIMHYESREDKMVILLKGQAKCFLPKTLEELDREIRRRRKMASQTQILDEEKDKPTSLPNFVSERKGRRRKSSGMDFAKKFLSPGGPNNASIQASPKPSPRASPRHMTNAIPETSALDTSLDKELESKTELPEPVSKSTPNLRLKFNLSGIKSKVLEASKTPQSTSILDLPDEASPNNSKVNIPPINLGLGSPGDSPTVRFNMGTAGNSPILKRGLNPTSPGESPASKGNLNNLLIRLTAPGDNSPAKQEETPKISLSIPESPANSNPTQIPPRLSLIIPPNNSLAPVPENPTSSGQGNNSNGSSVRNEFRRLSIRIPGSGENSPKRGPGRSFTMIGGNGSQSPKRSLNKGSNSPKKGGWGKIAASMGFSQKLDEDQSPTRGKTANFDMVMYDPETGQPISPTKSPTKRSRADIFKSFAKVRRVLPFVMKLSKIKETEKSTTNLLNLVKLTSRGDETDRYMAMESEYEDAIMKIFKSYHFLYYQGPLLKLKYDNTFYPGEAFGIRSLFVSAPSTRAVFASTDCVVLSLDKDMYERIMEREKSIVQHKLEVFTRIFKDMDEEHAVMFSHCWSTEIRFFGEYLFKEGDKSEFFYILGEGEVIIQKTMKDSKPTRTNVPAELPFGLRNVDAREKNLPLTKVVPGGFIGEEDYFEKRDRTVSAKVLTQEVVLFKMTVDREASLFGRYSEMFEEIHTKFKNKELWQKKRLNTLYEHYESDAVKKDKALMTQPAHDFSPEYITRSIFKVNREPQRLKIYITETEKKNYLKRLSNTASNLVRNKDEKHLEQRDKKITALENEVKKDEREYINMKSGVSALKSQTNTNVTKVSSDPAPLDMKKILIKRIKSTQLQRPVLGDLTPSRAFSRRFEDSQAPSFSKNSPAGIASRVSSKGRAQNLSIETEGIYNFENEPLSPGSILPLSAKSSVVNYVLKKQGTRVSTQANSTRPGSTRDYRSFPIIISSGKRNEETTSPDITTVQTLQMTTTEEMLIIPESVISPITNLKKIDEELELTPKDRQRIIIPPHSFTPIHNGHSLKTPKSAKGSIQPTVVKKPISNLKPLTVAKITRKEGKLQDLLRTQTSGFHRKTFSLSNGSVVSVKKNASNNTAKDFS